MNGIKKACDNAAITVMREVVFSECPKCGLNTLGKLGEVEVCVNCD